MFFGYGEESENVEVVINNVSEDKNYVNACIKNTKNYYNSCRIQTAPGMLCYYGDMGCFIFEGNIVANQPLTFFKGCQYDGQVNYGYIYEKCENKEDALDYDSDTTTSSYLYEVASYYGFDDILDDLSECNADIKSLTDKLRERISTLSDFEVSKFEDGLGYCDEKYNFYKLLDYLYEEYDWDGCDFKSKAYTPRFIECCDRLVKFADTILDKIGYSTKKG